MSPNMLKKLQRNLDYHAKMAEHFNDLHEEEEKKNGGKKPAEAKPADTKPADTRPTASSAHPAAKPPESDNKKLANLHAEVVKQLEPLVTAGTIPSKIDQALASQRIMRNTSADIKPAAGRFH